MPLVYGTDDVYYEGNSYNLNLILMYATYYAITYLGLEWEYIENGPIPGVTFYLPVNPSPAVISQFLHYFEFGFHMLTHLVEYYVNYL